MNKMAQSTSARYLLLNESNPLCVTDDATKNAVSLMVHISSVVAKSS